MTLVWGGMGYMMVVNRAFIVKAVPPSRESSRAEGRGGPDGAFAIVCSRRAREPGAESQLIVSSEFLCMSRVRSIVLFENENYETQTPPYDDAAGAGAGCCSCPGLGGCAHVQSRAAGGLATFGLAVKLPPTPAAYPPACAELIRGLQPIV